MAQIHNHPSEEIRAALIRLCDALCSWERSTGIESALILKEANWKFRASSGKPVPDSLNDVSDEEILAIV